MVKIMAQILLASIIAVSTCSAMEEENRRGIIHKYADPLVKKAKKTKLIVFKKLKREKDQSPPNASNISKEGKAIHGIDYTKAREKLFFDQLIVKELTEQFPHFPMEIRQIIFNYSIALANKIPMIYSFPDWKTLKEKFSTHANNGEHLYFDINGVKINLFYKINIDILDPLMSLFISADVRKSGLQKIYQCRGTMQVCVYNEYLTDTFLESSVFKIDGFYALYNQTLGLAHYTLTIAERSGEGSYKLFDQNDRTPMEDIPTNKLGFLLRKKVIIS